MDRVRFFVYKGITYIHTLLSILPGGKLQRIMGRAKSRVSEADQIAAYANVSYLGQFNKYPHLTSSGIRKNAH